MSVGISFGSLTTGTQAYNAPSRNSLLSEIKQALASADTQGSLKSLSTAATDQTSNETAVKKDYMADLNDYMTKIESEYEKGQAERNEKLNALTEDKAKTQQELKDKHDQKEKISQQNRMLLFSLTQIKRPKMNGLGSDAIADYTEQMRAYNKQYGKKLANIVPLRVLNTKVEKDIVDSESKLSSIDKQMLEQYDAEKQAKLEKELAQAEANALAAALTAAKAKAEADAKAKAEAEALALSTKTNETTTTATTSTSNGFTLNA